MTVFKDIPNDHIPSNEEVPRRYWPVITVWDVVEVSQGAPIYMLEFIRSTNLPIVRSWLVQEDLVLFDALEQIGTRWISGLKVFNPFKSLQDSDVAVISELWRSNCPNYGKDIALVRDTKHKLYAPSVVGVDTDDLMKRAKLVWHRKEHVDNKH